MKSGKLLKSMILCLFSFNCLAQVPQANSRIEEKNDNQGNIKKGTMTSIIKTVKTVKTYHVEETVNLKFGGHTTIYDVPDPKLINTFDLGPNNTRVVTIVYNKVEQNTKVVTPLYTSVKHKDEVTIIPHNEPVVPTNTKVEPISSIQINTKPSHINSKVIIDSPKKMGDYAYIDIIKTYERVTEKGYKSVDMLKKVCNAYFFDDEMEKAATCYTKLFALTTDVTPEFYYRYSISLKAIGKEAKAEENLEKFNQLSGNSIK